VTLAGIAILDLAERRMAWIDDREKILAQNIANADTPGWKPADIGSFSADIRQAQVNFARTDPRHLPPTTGLAAQMRKASSERAPDGNAVSLDDQLAKLAETETAHDLASDLYKKYLGFFRLAIGR